MNNKPRIRILQESINHTTMRLTGFFYIKIVNGEMFEYLGEEVRWFWHL